MDRVLGIVLAGGGGQRLLPLTKERSKPSVPFAGKYRIIDFVLSNCINSGIRQIYVLTQYRSGSLNVHIQEAWGISSSGLDDYIYCVPAQQKSGLDWYKGTADAVRQNIDLIMNRNIDFVLILSGDHIYKMDYRQLINFHKARKADVTLSAIRVKKDSAKNTFGVFEVDNEYRLKGFEEKPTVPKTLPDNHEYSFISMGVYVFNIDVLLKVLEKPDDDFGRDVIPKVFGTHKVFIYDYESENSIQDFIARVVNGKRECILVDKTRDSNYWRDVGTIDSYYEANMDLIGIDPGFNLYGQKWPFRTYQRKLPPSKFILGGIAQDSVVSEGCIISGGIVRRSILSPGVVVERDAVIEDSILLDDVIVEPMARVRRAIIDKQATISNGSVIGYDHQADKNRGFTVSNTGIVIIPKNTYINKS
jgi:glucose-1-phosphate adenylyltransferase